MTPQVLYIDNNRHANMIGLFNILSMINILSLESELAFDLDDEQLVLIFFVVFVRTMSFHQVSLLDTCISSVETRK